MLQTYARRYAEAIDTLTFRTNILPRGKNEIDKSPEDGVNIHGLYLQGASWNWKDSKLKEPAFGELWHEMPAIW